MCAYRPIKKCSNNFQKNKLTQKGLDILVWGLLAFLEFKAKISVLNCSINFGISKRGYLK